MDFGWINNTKKRIVNPARYFFDKEVISGKNAQIGDIYREVNTPEQVYIDSLLDKRDNITDFGELISILNVKYVILTGESDYKKYFFLFNQTDLEFVKQTKNFFIFKNKFDVKKIYQTDDIDNIGTEKIGLEYEQLNPVRYELEENISKKYIVFTEPFSIEWKLDGRSPLDAYGVVNAFENSGNKIRFERFYRINLPAYFISILTFIGLMAKYTGLDSERTGIKLLYSTLFPELPRFNHFFSILSLLVLLNFQIFLSFPKKFNIILLSILLSILFSAPYCATLSQLLTYNHLSI